MNENTRKTRILYHYMRGASAGGSDTCLYLLLKNLDRTKYEPIVLYRDSSIFVEELQEMGIKLIPIPEKIKERLYAQTKRFAEEEIEPKQNNGVLKSLLKKSNKLSMFLSNLKHLTKKLPEKIQYLQIIIKNNIDIIHTNHDITSDHSMILSSIFLRKKIVSHNRGLYIPMAIDTYFSKYINQIICMSDFSKSIYVNNGVSEKKCKTIYDGIDTELFQPNGNNGDNNIISCIGRLEKWKGQQVLIDAAELIVKKNPEMKFLLIGTGDNESELREQIKDKGLVEFFEFTGHITNVKDYIEKSNIIVHTSIVPEPFGMVITEAMALEKVVIATNFGGPVEIISDGEDGILVPSEDPKALAEQINKVAADDELRKRISKQARQKVLLKFDVKKYAKQIEREYDQILKN